MAVPAWRKRDANGRLKSFSDASEQTRAVGLSLTRENSTKFYASSGISVRTRDNYDLVGWRGNTAGAADCDAVA